MIKINKFRRTFTISSRRTKTEDFYVSLILDVSEGYQ